MKGEGKIMGIKLMLLIVFFVVMVAVGLYSRKHARSVDGFVLGGRSVGPWLTAFAYGTSYFSAVVLSDMPDSLDGSMAWHLPGLGLGMPCWGVCWRGSCWGAVLRL